MGREDVESLGDDGREVVVLRTDHDPATSATCLPEWAGGRIENHGAAHRQGQIDAEPDEGDLEILRLAPPLARLGADARGAMDEDHRRLDLIAVLAPPAPSAARD